MPGRRSPSSWCRRRGAASGASTSSTRRRSASTAANRTGPVRARTARRAAGCRRCRPPAASSSASGSATPSDAPVAVGSALRSASSSVPASRSAARSRWGGGVGPTAVCVGRGVAWDAPSRWSFGVRVGRSVSSGDGVAWASDAASARCRSGKRCRGCRSRRRRFPRRRCPARGCRRSRSRPTDRRCSSAHRGALARERSTARLERQRAARADCVADAVRAAGRLGRHARARSRRRARIAQSPPHWPLAPPPQVMHCGSTCRRGNGTRRPPARGARGRRRRRRRAARSTRRSSSRPRRPRRSATRRSCSRWSRTTAGPTCGRSRRCPDPTAASPSTHPAGRTRR